MSEAYIPPKLEEIIEDFGLCQGSEKLEYLLEFSERLPALPERLQSARDSMETVHECMTPVFLYGEQEDDGKMVYYFDAPRESPTARGFATLLMEGINHAATPAQILEIPDTFYTLMGLQKVLSPQRMRGIGTFLGYMKRIARQQLNDPSAAAR